MKATMIALLASATALLAAPQPSHAQEGKTVTNSQTPAAPAVTKSGHIAQNGVNYYYEIRGQGEPLLLLHGGLGTIDMFGPVLPMLAAGRQVIGVDLHGHGRTQLGNRPIRMEDIGDDMAGLVKALGYGQVDVLGYSFGGGVALRMGIQHPEAVRRLVVASASFRRESFYPELLPQQAQVGAAMAEMMKQTPMYAAYAAVAPDVAEFPKLLDAMGKLITTPFDWSDDVKKLTMPVMLVYGDSDMFRPEEIVKFYQMLGGGLKDAGWMRENMPKNRLAILPDLTHYELFAAPALATTVLPFLNGQTGAKSWAEQVAK
jgi:pimeloyl-ACP methyl ester carboxylesterase